MQRISGRSFSYLQNRLIPSCESMLRMGMSRAPTQLHIGNGVKWITTSIEKGNMRLFRRFFSTTRGKVITGLSSLSTGGIVMAGVWGYASGSTDDKGMTSLKKKLESIRKNYSGIRTTPVTYSEENGVLMVSYRFSTYVDFFQLLSKIVELLGRDGSVSLQDVSKEGEIASISLVYGDGERSMEILYDGSDGRVSFFADRNYDETDIAFISSVYEYCLQCHFDATSSASATARTKEVINKLETMGVGVYMPKKNAVNTSDDKEIWDQIAGYDQIKQDIKDTIILSIQYPEKYQEIARKTRKNYTCPLPRSLLFEGPPGTGKTSIARIIAQESNIVLVHIPLESIVNKYYGESEKRLNSILKLCNEIDNCIIFIDEIDSVVTSRDSDDMHEVTRRLLSVLLRFLEGFDNSNLQKEVVNTKRSILICATNRKQDLDSALLSRFDVQLHFGLPDEKARQQIFARYAKQLSPTELAQLASQSEGMSGRDIRDSCEIAERAWVSMCIREKKNVTVPPMTQYVEAVKRRMEETKVQHSFHPKAFGFDM